MKIRKLPKTTFLKGGTVLDPLKETSAKKDVLIVNGKIKSVGKGKAPASSEVVDCTGKVITHGFCDVHVHFREPGREDKETLQTGSRAALAGGFTRVCVMPNTDPPLDSPESIRFIAEKAEDCPVHIHPIGAVTKGQKGSEITEMSAMVREGAVAFSDDGIPIANAAVMRRALEYASMLGKPIINHAEDLDLRDDGVMHEGEMSLKLGLDGNPALAESLMVLRDLDLAKLASAFVHIPHVSTRESVQHIVVAKKGGTPVSAEVSPHHLYFNDTALNSYNTNFKVAPPLREEADRKALVKGIVSGTIDCIATDHAPHTIEEKEATFVNAPFGMIGLESCFGAVHTVLMKEKQMTLANIVKLMTVNPRNIMGFETDLFKTGTEAELTVLDPKESWTFDEDSIYSRSKNSPYIGEIFTGKVDSVITKGNITDL
ncbi:MAG: dihydroorotase [Candidatus Marinimicrobia bacterium]|jgi:dihydroorotase|nr:dihydroorotase [Candidatus Neomarinimicrobiota bacterium]